ncbi:MAG TPA: hypothetical protein ENH41_05080, partial [Candidatus Omnitrophica bacterium]|nr:hypothetical protein [Candidatus Omnitrophota bacterium]
LKTSAFPGLIMHDSGKSDSVNYRGQDCLGSSKGYFLRGTVQELISSKDGFVRLDPSAEIMKLLAAGSEIDGGKLLYNIVSAVEMLIREVNPDKELVILDLVKELFKTKYDIQIPEIVTLGEFARLVNDIEHLSSSPIKSKSAEKNRRIFKECLHEIRKLIKEADSGNKIYTDLTGALLKFEFEKINSLLSKHPEFINTNFVNLLSILLKKVPVHMLTNWDNNSTEYGFYSPALPNNLLKDICRIFSLIIDSRSNVVNLKRVKEAVNELILFVTNRNSEISEDKMAIFTILFGKYNFPYEFYSMPSKFHTINVDHEGSTTYWSPKSGFATGFSLRGTVSYPLDSREGFVRLDPPTDKEGFLRAKLGVFNFITKNAKARYNEILTKEIIDVAIFLSEGVNLRKELVLVDRIKQIFKRKYDIQIPEVVSMGEFLSLLEGKLEESASPIKVKVKVSDPLGIHNRTAIYIAGIAEAYPDTKIYVRKGSKAANALKASELIRLGAGPGQEVEIETAGKDVRAAMKEGNTGSSPVGKTTIRNFIAELEKRAKDAGYAVDAQTKFSLLVGGNVKTSPSFRIFNYLLKIAEENVVYLPYEISSKKELEGVIRILRQEDRLIEVVISDPYKVSVIKYLDELTGPAKKAYAVNNVVRKEDRLVGSMFDGMALVYWWKNVLNRTLDDKKIIHLGAGGVARAVAAAITDETPRAELIFTDIIKERIDSLKAIIDSWGRSTKVKVIDVSEYSGSEELDYELTEADIIINGTGLGKNKGNIYAYPDLDYTGMKGSVAIDWNYRPAAKNLFLKYSEDNGAEIHNALGFLITGFYYTFHAISDKREIFDYSDLLRFAKKDRGFREADEIGFDGDKRLITARRELSSWMLDLDRKNPAEVIKQIKHRLKHPEVDIIEHVIVVLDYLITRDPRFAKDVLNKLRDYFSVTGWRVLSDAIAYHIPRLSISSFSPVNANMPD